MSERIEVINLSELMPWYALMIAAKQFGDGERDPAAVEKEQEEIVKSSWYTVRRRGYAVTVEKSQKVRGGRKK